MFPKLFDLGPITVYTYGVLLAVAYLVGLKLAVSRSRRQGLDSDRVLDLGIYVIISALVGAKLMLLIVDFDYFRQRPEEIWTLARSGGVFYGGLVLSFLVAIWFLRRHRLPLWTTTDMFAPGIALGHAIGRVGCLLAGCCHGRPTDVPWAVTFTDPLAAANVGTPLNVPLHPTQVYEAGAELLIFVVLLVSERRGRSFAGRTFWLYVLLYSIARFIIEFFRGDQRGMMLGISTSQFISLVLLPFSILMLIWLSRRPHPSDETSAVSARSRRTVRS